MNLFLKDTENNPLIRKLVHLKQFPNRRVFVGKEDKDDPAELKTQKPNINRYVG